MKEALKFTWIAWYLVGLAVGAFLWESHLLAFLLGAIAAFSYCMARYIEKRWTWEQFHADEELG